MTKIDILVTLNLNRDFHKYLPKLKVFENFWPKLRYLQILTQIDIFSEFFLLKSTFFAKKMTKIDILVSFIPNRNLLTILIKNREFSTILAKSGIFRKFVLKSTYLQILTKMNIVFNFDQIRHFGKFKLKSIIFDNFYQNQVFSTILTKFKIFRQFSPKSIFPNQHF